LFVLFEGTLAVFPFFNPAVFVEAVKMKSNSKGGSTRLIALVVGCVLLAGCADLIKGPPPALNPGDGRVVIVIGSGIERTIFPRTDQFSKIALSFEQKDGEGTMPPVEAGMGETVILLKPGAWEITADAYNAADPPAIAAQAKNTLTRNPDNTITGDTYFALEPAGTGPGVLRYTIVPPEGISLDGARSRIRIEKDGEVLAGLNGDGFAAGVRAISAAINEGTVSLDPGRYVIDIVLDDAASINTAAWRDIAVILPGLITDLAFEPGAGDFLDPDEWAALSAGGTFGRTKNNSSQLSLGTSGGAGANRTQELLASNGEETVYFTLTKARLQTITLGGTAAGEVSVATGGTVDGHTASLTQAVFTVKTAALADSGGSLEFTVSLGETGKTPLVYTVTVNIATLTSLRAETWPSKRVYIIGEDFDPTGLSLVGVYSDGKQKPVTGGYAVKDGFDTSTAGDRLIQIEKHGVSTNDGFTINVLAPSGRALFFWHGLTPEYEPSPHQYYRVPNGRAFVLAPVQRLIPDNAVYEWKVDGVVQNGHNTEYFRYTANSASGEHTVRVAAKVGGDEIAAAETRVIHAAGASSRPLQGNSGVGATKLYSVVAPGQFGSGSDRLGDLHGFGGFGGYAVFKFDHSVAKKAGGEEIQIGGNAFSGWNEPGAIWVSQDDNNNGEPDDAWYELKGSHTLEPLTLRNYAVTYRSNGSYVDNLGNGEEAAHWWRLPEGVPPGITEMTLVGTRLDMSYVIGAAALWGYADVFDNGRVSLSNAIQADGTPVDLPFIDFVKIVTAVHFWEDAVNERSTEANTPKDRGMADPDKYINGDGPYDGQYRYTFWNNSGYDLTVEILEGGETFSLDIGASVIKTIPKSGIYIDFYGGNVKLWLTAGGNAYFNSGEGAE
jgi:hypothetical protein